MTAINMNDSNDCIGYIDKLKSFGSNFSPGELLIGAHAGGYSNMVYCLDDRAPTNSAFFPESAFIIPFLTNTGVQLTNIYYGPPGTNLLFINGATNVAGYWSWGTHGHLFPDFAVDGEMQFEGDSGWFIMTTGESFNGRRFEMDQSTFISWFASNAFGGTNYQSTPVGAIGQVDEPGLYGLSGIAALPLWSSGKNFAICAWQSRSSSFFQAVGDPFITR